MAKCTKAQPALILIAHLHQVAGVLGGLSKTRQKTRGCKLHRQGSRGCSEIGIFSLNKLVCAGVRRRDSDPHPGTTRAFLLGCLEEPARK